MKSKWPERTKWRDMILAMFFVVMAPLAFYRGNSTEAVLWLILSRLCLTEVTDD